MKKQIVNKNKEMKKKSNRIAKLQDRYGTRRVLSFLKANFLIICILIIAAVSITLTNRLALEDYPESADEHSYLLSATIYSQNKLYVDSPSNKRVFDYYHMVDDGKFYGKYLPGWPFFLSLAVRLKIPMLANLFFGVAAIFVTFLIARKLFSDVAAYITAILMSLSPYVMLFSASYFSHSTTMFFLSLSTLFFIHAIEEGKRRYFIYFGVCIGIIFNTRLFDCILFSCFSVLVLALVNYSKIRFGKQWNREYVFSFPREKSGNTESRSKKSEFTITAIKDSVNKLISNIESKYKSIIDKNVLIETIPNTIKDILYMFYGFAPFLAIFLIYNYILTGNPLISPYLYPYTLSNFTRLDILGFTNSSFSAVYGVCISNLKMLTLMVPALLFLIVFTFMICETSKRKIIIALLSIILLFLIAHSFYWSGGSTYLKGRYLYASVFAMYLIAGYGFARLFENHKALSITLVMLFIVSSLYFTYDNFFIFKSLASTNRQIYEMADNSTPDNSIIFFDLKIPHGIHIMSATQYINYAIKFDKANKIFSNFRYWGDETSMRYAAFYPGRSAYAFKCWHSAYNESMFKTINILNDKMFCNVYLIGSVPLNQTIPVQN